MSFISLSLLQVSHSCLNIIRLCDKSSEILCDTAMTARALIWLLSLQKALRVKWHAVRSRLFNHLIWHLSVLLWHKINHIRLRDAAFVVVLLWGGWCWGASSGTLGGARSCRGRPRHRSPSLGVHVRRSATQRGYPAERETQSTSCRDVGVSVHRKTWKKLCALVNNPPLDVDRSCSQSSTCPHPTLHHQCKAPSEWQHI